MFPPVDLEEGFFRFNRPSKKEELVNFVEKLKDYATRAYDAPTGPLQALVIVDQLQFSHDPNLLLPSHGRRKLPHLICTDIFRRTEAIDLLLDTPLQTGKRNWSQVWRCTVASRDAPNETPIPAVVKIFQESFFKHFPSLSDFAGEWESAEWYPGAHMAASEAWAFDRMKTLQGYTIPWSYGFFKFLLPNGELAFGHVMEFIDGILPCEQRAQNLKLDDSGVFDLADALATALHDIHRFDIAHGDIKGNNVILFPDPTRISGLSVVILDFAWCEVIGDCEIAQRQLERDFSGVGPILGEMKIPETQVREWCLTSAQQEDRPWGAVFAELCRYYFIELSDDDDL